MNHFFFTLKNSSLKRWKITRAICTRWPRRTRVYINPNAADPHFSLLIEVYGWLSKAGLGQPPWDFLKRVPTNSQLRARSRLQISFPRVCIDRAARPRSAPKYAPRTPGKLINWVSPLCNQTRLFNSTSGPPDFPPADAFCAFRFPLFYHPFFAREGSLIRRWNWEVHWMRCTSAIQILYLYEKAKLIE